MGDRSHATIDIGGNLARDRIGELACLLNDSFGSPGNGQSFDDLILAVSNGGSTLTFDEDNCQYGYFGFEKQLVDLGLCYDLRYAAGCEYAEGMERFRPGMPEPRGFATSGGEVVVPSGIARTVIAMISNGKLVDAMTRCAASPAV